MKKLVLFDLDGTLVTTGGAGCQALAKGAEKLYAKPVKFEHSLISGRTDLDNFAIIYGLIHKGKKPAIRELKKMEKAYVDQLPTEVNALVRAHKYYVIIERNYKGQRHYSGLRHREHRKRGLY